MSITSRSATSYDVLSSGGSASAATLDAPSDGQRPHPSGQAQPADRWRVAADRLPRENQLDNGEADGWPQLNPRSGALEMADPYDARLTFRTDGGDKLYAIGDIDLYQAQDFRTAGEEHINAVAHPCIDLSAVPYLDSAGLATLLHLTRLAKSQQKCLRVIASGGPRRVLRITGIDKVLEIEA